MTRLSPPHVALLLILLVGFSGCREQTTAGTSTQPVGVNNPTSKQDMAIWDRSDELRPLAVISSDMEAPKARIPGSMYSLSVTSSKGSEGDFPGEELELVIQSSSGDATTHFFHSAYGSFRLEAVDLTGDGSPELVLIRSEGRGVSATSEFMDILEFTPPKISLLMTVPYSAFAGPQLHWAYHHRYFKLADNRIAIRLDLAVEHIAGVKSPLDDESLVPADSVRIITLRPDSSGHACLLAVDTASAPLAVALVPPKQAKSAPSPAQSEVNAATQPASPTTQADGKPVIELWNNGVPGVQKPFLLFAAWADGTIVRPAEDLTDTPAKGGGSIFGLGKRKLKTGMIEAAAVVGLQESLTKAGLSKPPLAHGILFPDGPSQTLVVRDGNGEQLLSH